MGTSLNHSAARNLVIDPAFSPSQREAVARHERIVRDMEHYPDDFLAEHRLERSFANLQKVFGEVRAFGVAIQIGRKVMNDIYGE